MKRSAAPSVLGSSKKRATFSTPWSHTKDTKPSMDDTTRPSNPLMVKKNDFYLCSIRPHPLTFN